MKKTNQSSIQAKMFNFAVFELVRNQRNSFEPIWTVDSWVKLLIWLSLNCGLSGEKESLQSFADALGSTLTIRMRKIFFERTLEDLALHLIADPAEAKVFVMPVASEISLTYDRCKEALNIVGLTARVITDSSQWEEHDQLIAIPWNSSESGC